MQALVGFCVAFPTATAYSATCLSHRLSCASNSSSVLKSTMVQPSDSSKVRSTNPSKSAVLNQCHRSLAPAATVPFALSSALEDLVLQDNLDDRNCGGHFVPVRTQYSSVEGCDFFDHGRIDAEGYSCEDCVHERSIPGSAWTRASISYVDNFHVHSTRFFRFACGTLRDRLHVHGRHRSRFDDRIFL
jgi:hypothetical protein